jgi:hypothetical protein
MSSLLMAVALLPAATKKLGAVFADDLTPDKARVLTMLAFHNPKLRKHSKPSSTSSGDQVNSGHYSDPQA